MYMVVGAGVRERSLCDGCSRATLPQLCVQLERRENAQYCAPVRVGIVCCLDRVSVQCTNFTLGFVNPTLKFMYILPMFVSLVCSHCHPPCFKLTLMWAASP